MEARLPDPFAAPKDDDATLQARENAADRAAYRREQEAEATAAETLARLRHTLDQVQPGDTLILAHHNAQGGIITHTLGSDPARLADTARTLLDQALDMLDSAAPTIEARHLKMCVARAFEELPDPLSDDNDDDEGEDA